MASDKVAWWKVTLGVLNMVAGLVILWHAVMVGRLLGFRVEIIVCAVLAVISFTSGYYLVRLKPIRGKKVLGSLNILAGFVVLMLGILFGLAAGDMLFLAISVVLGVILVLGGVDLIYPPDTERETLGLTMMSISIPLIVAALATVLQVWYLPVIFGIAGIILLALGNSLRKSPL